MSSRKLSTRSTSSRRGRGRGCRKRTSSDDDILPLSSSSTFLVTKQAKTKNKASPLKRTKRAKTALTAAPAIETINLDDTPESVEMLRNVNMKIDNFVRSGSFISSDEDEAELIKAKTNKKLFPNQLFISDDSDDDCKIVKEPSDFINIDCSTPSTSAGTSKNSSKDINSETVQDGIMDIVNSVLDNKAGEQDSLKDLKSLEDYRKETEELLKSASALLNEFTGSKTKPEEKEVSSPKVTIGSCPVCLESLANRPASVTVCGHIFCKECIMQTARTLKKCPTCRKPVTMKKIHPIYF